MASWRISFLRLVHACATVVQTQNKLISAATTLQRAWRKVLDSRIERLNRDVGQFQAVAKAWLVKRRIQRSAVNARAIDQSFRMMGRW